MSLWAYLRTCRDSTPGEISAEGLQGPMAEDEAGVKICYCRRRPVLFWCVKASFDSIFWWWWCGADVANEVSLVCLWFGIHTEVVPSGLHGTERQTLGVIVRI